MTRHVAARTTRRITGRAGATRAARLGLALAPLLISASLVLAAPVPAQAQQTSPPGYPARAPDQVGPAEARERGFIVADTMNQYLAMDLVGATVYGPGGESIGEVSDMIFHEEGPIVGLIVGVGGFLGIGEKDVGIPFEIATIERPPAPPPAAALAATGRSPQRLEVRVPLTREELDAAPAFARADPGWAPRPAPGVPATGVPEPPTPVAPQ